LIGRHLRGYNSAQVVTGLAHNAGHNCIKAEVVVTAAEWPLREKFLGAIRCCPHALRLSAADQPNVMISMRAHRALESVDQMHPMPSLATHTCTIWSGNGCRMVQEAAWQGPCSQTVVPGEP
jgi:hypothetical protein